MADEVELDTADGVDDDVDDVDDDCAAAVLAFSFSSILDFSFNLSSTCFSANSSKPCRRLTVLEFAAVDDDAFRAGVLLSAAITDEDDDVDDKDGEDVEDEVEAMDDGMDEDDAVEGGALPNK